MLVRLALIAALTALAACNPKVRAEGVLPREPIPTPPSEPRAVGAKPKPGDEGPILVQPGEQQKGLAVPSR